MILSRGRRYLFVHIPKTGGTALTLALEARAMKDDVILSDTPKGRARAGRQRDLSGAGRLWKHSTLADLGGIVSAAELEELFILTLVRNPWDQLVSYYHWLRGQSFDHPAVGLAKSIDFSGFLNNPLTKTSFRAHPVSAYTRDASGRDRATLCARIEAIEEDLAPFEAHLGFRLTPLPRANESERPRDWRGLYSDHDAALVAEICAEDIARFGYRFDR
ncbi:MAG TPA: Type II secretory pathway, pullulanase PulA [Paracoccaceae bacterium]|nr:Type II secretory pathway, pullulanase PulA [Paracoccaceae bacterium]